MPNRKVAFWSNQLCERGTSIALFDYAFYNQKLLNNKSIIFYSPNASGNIKSVVEKFKKEFKVYDVGNFQEVDGIIKREKIETMIKRYIIFH